MNFFMASPLRQIRPDFSENYTFYTNADDGARLWIDRVLLIDTWSNRAAETSATAILQANYLHDIIVEYKELLGNAYAELRWSSPSTPKQIVAACVGLRVVS